MHAHSHHLRVDYSLLMHACLLAVVIATGIGRHGEVSDNDDACRCKAVQPELAQLQESEARYSCVALHCYECAQSALRPR